MIQTHFPFSQFIVVSLKEGMFNNANVIFRTKFVDGVSAVTRTTNNARRCAAGANPRAQDQDVNRVQTEDSRDLWNVSPSPSAPPAGKSPGVKRGFGYKKFVDISQTHPRRAEPPATCAGATPPKSYGLAVAVKV